jgi:hypothetical protein
VVITFRLIHQWILTPITHNRLVKSFTRQDFTAQFTASVGGFFWLLLTPVCNIIIYAFVFSYIFKIRAVEDFGETSFVLFLMIGYLPWFAFAESVGKSTSLLLDKASLITKVKFPVQVLPLSGTLVPYLTHTIGIIFTNLSCDQRLRKCHVDNLTCNTIFTIYFHNGSCCFTLFTQRLFAGFTTTCSAYYFNLVFPHTDYLPYKYDSERYCS